MRLIILLMVLVGGCAGRGGLVTTVQADAAKARIAADNSFTAAFEIALPLVKAGAIDQIAFFKADHEAYDALLAIRAADDAGNGADLTTQMAKFTAAIGDITAMVAKANPAAAPKGVTP